MLLRLAVLMGIGAFGRDLPAGTTLRIGCTVACPESYAAALESAARSIGVGLELTTIAPRADGDYSAALAELDGVISPGGHDIDPRYYTSKVDAATRERLEREHRRFGNGGESSPEFSKPEHAARDAREFALMSAYFKQESLRSLPLLGVCYGMQMMAASRGLPMVVDLTHDLGIAPRRSTDRILLEPAAPASVRDALGPAFSAAKSHHQAVDLAFLRSHRALYPDVQEAATSNEGRVLEMMTMKDRPALGIQFHAERSDPKVAAAVFGWFLEKARERRRSASSPWRDSRQIVWVTARSADGVRAKVKLLEKDGAGWKTVVSEVPAVIGERGLAVGDGLPGIDFSEAGLPVKKEGDLKTPAGVFLLGDAYGYAPEPPAGSKLKYHQLFDYIQGVDDPASDYYNRIVDTRAIAGGWERHWRSHETMRRSDDLYKWLVVVRHNDGNVPGHGSLIFLHVWRNADSGTAGCTALAETDLLRLLARLDPDKNPVLVQLPAGPIETRLERLLQAR